VTKFDWTRESKPTQEARAGRGERAEPESAMKSRQPCDHVWGKWKPVGLFDSINERRECSLCHAESMRAVRKRPRPKRR
jgi:hypothetical protein